MPATLHQLRSEQTREPLLDAAIALMDATGSGRWLAETLCPRQNRPQLPVLSQSLQSQQPFSTEDLNLTHQATLTTAPAV